MKLEITITADVLAITHQDDGEVWLAAGDERDWVTVRMTPRLLPKLREMVAKMESFASFQNALQSAG